MRSGLTIAMAGNLFAVLMLPCSAGSQMSAQRLMKISVIDPTGAGIPNAEIGVTDDESKKVRTEYCDSNGNHEIEVPYHRYHIDVMSQGFHPLTLSLSSGESRPVVVQVMLTVGGGSRVDIEPDSHRLLEPEVDHLYDLVVPPMRDLIDLKR